MNNYLKRPIIFFGFPRSGTTIISEIFLQHHKLAWISNYQNKFPYSPGISLIRNMFQNYLWDIRGQKKQLNSVPFLNRYIFKPAESYRLWNSLTKRSFRKSFLFQVEENPNKIDEIRSFLEKVVRYQRRERLAFKITGPSRLMYLHSIFPDACFIRITRNPLPTIRSLLNVGFWNDENGKEELWWNGTKIYSDLEKAFIENLKKNRASLLAAIQYYKVNQVYMEEKRLCNANVLEIVYEDFIDKPNEIVNSVLNFTDLNIDDDIETHLNENKIYNRNMKQDFFIGPILDKRILKIAYKGIF